MRFRSHPNGSAEDYQVCRGPMTMSARRRGAATVVAVGGAIDATTTDYLGGFLREYIQGFIPGRRALVVDLTAVEHCGVQAVPTLFAVDQQCRRAGVDWALVPGDWVSPLLRLADGVSILPATNSLNEAFDRIKHGARTA